MARWCSVEGCGRKSYALNLCRKHYWRFRVYGTTERVKRPRKDKGKIRVDLTGERFGRLLILNQVDPPRENKQRGAWWSFICDCGITGSCRSSNLVRKDTKSCGCLGQETRLISGGKYPTPDRELMQVFLGYRKPAIKVGRQFDLTLEDFRELTQLPCIYCGRTGVNSRKNRRTGRPFRYNGLDRVDNKVGYTLTNVAPCCGPCNFLKRGMLKDEFIELCMAIAAHQINKEAA